jgi:hypothetical protein
LDAAKRSRLVLAFGGFHDDGLTALAGYYSALYWSWTTRQRQAAHAWRSGSAPPGRAGPSAHSHLRRRMAWPLVEAGDRIFQATLERAT